MNTSKDAPDGFTPPHGGYQQLASYQKALVVDDATRYFCRRFVSRSDRTYDQMVQAARSGKQNIVEGSKASGTSKAMELKLTNVARASLEKLLEDYRDFLRVRDLELCRDGGRIRDIPVVKLPGQGREGGSWLDLDPFYMGLAATPAERAARYREWLRQTIPEGEWKLIREATQRGQLAGRGKFVDEISN